MSRLSEAIRTEVAVKLESVGSPDAISEVISVAIGQFWKTRVVALLPSTTGSTMIVYDRDRLIPTLLWKAKKGDASFRLEFDSTDNKSCGLTVTGVDYAGKSFKSKSRRKYHDIGPSLISNMFSELMGERSEPGDPWGNGPWV